jgi:hypothetical protein
MQVKSREERKIEHQVPLVIRIVAAVVVLAVVINLLAGIGMVVRHSDWLSRLENTVVTQIFWQGVGSHEYGLYLTASSALAAVVLVGFIRLRRWAWTMFMVWAMFNLTIQLARYYLGNPNFFGMLVNSSVVFILNLHEVRKMFDALHRDKESNATED